MAPPPILYKYRSLAPQDFERTVGMIRRNEVWYSSVKAFNDPFESRALVSLSGDDDDWQRVLGCNRPDTSAVERVVADLEADGIRDEAAALGMFCLSAVPDDILMWSHYASSHRGLCLGFSTTGNSLFWDAQPVQYSNQYPNIEYLTMTSEQRVRTMLLRKSKSWEHEQEWRAFRAGPEPGFAVYPPAMLVAIVLGAEITERDRDIVVQEAARLQDGVQLFQAHRNQREYRIDVAPLPGATSVPFQLSNGRNDWGGPVGNSERKVERSVDSRMEDGVAPEPDSSKGLGPDWTLADEREFIESLVNQRFNFLLVWFGLVVVGAVEARTQTYLLIALWLGAMVAVPVCLAIIGAHWKLEWILREFRTDLMHPITRVSAAGRHGNARWLIGYLVPTIIASSVVVGALLASTGVLVVSD